MVRIFKRVHMVYRRHVDGSLSTMDAKAVEADKSLIAKMSTMNMNINQYVNQVNVAWNYQNADLLSAFLSYRHNHAKSQKLRAANPEAIACRVLEKPLDEVVSNHIRCVMAIQDGDVLQAFQHQYAMLQAVTKLFQAQREQNWTLKIVQITCLELRLLAGPADAAAGNKKHPVECMEKTAEGLMACFRICAADNRSSEQETKKWGMLMLANQMFKVYFKINRHHLCKPLVRAIESCPLKERFPLAQRITYKFYTGQRALFDADYNLADECLSFCFQNCHRQSLKNKRSILIYLVPVKMILGLMPKKSLLEKYQLTNFSEVVSAVKQGNLARLSEIIDENRAFLIKHSIYIIMQRLSMIATRNLLKKVYHIVGSHQIPVEMFLKALLTTRVEDATWEEAECLLANLIVEGVVKGYISSQHDMLVVSKLNPFPVLSSVKYSKRD